MNLIVNLLKLVFICGLEVWRGVERNFRGTEQRPSLEFTQAVTSNANKILF